MEIAGIDQGLIGWQSTRRQQIADVLPALTAQAAYALDRQAADGSVGQRAAPP